MAKNRTQKNRSHGIGKIPQHAATFCGVQHWFKAEFEKLGWMLLAKEKGYDFKVVAYKRAIRHMIMTIEHLMTEYSEADRIHDLNVLLMESKVLNEFVNKHL
jgi:hypothetical protein